MNSSTKQIRKDLETILGNLNASIEAAVKEKESQEAPAQVEAAQKKITWLDGQRYAVDLLLWKWFKKYEREVGAGE